MRGKNSWKRSSGGQKKPNFGDLKRKSNLHQSPLLVLHHNQFHRNHRCHLRPFPHLPQLLSPIRASLHSAKNSPG